MAITTLSAWKADGSPFILCTPIADLAATFKFYGYPVFWYPDDRHLQANPPEDHTPFSRTSWPGAQPYPHGMAGDFMPHPDPAMPTLARIAGQILADKKANKLGTRWLKYMNSTDAASKCWNDSWTPHYVRSPSTDRGHIHLSCRSDYVTSHDAQDYDPIGELMSTALDNADNVNALIYRIWGLINLADSVDLHVPGHPPERNQLALTLKALIAKAGDLDAKLKALDSKVSALQTGTGMTPEQIASIVEAAVTKVFDRTHFTSTP